MGRRGRGWGGGFPSPLAEPTQKRGPPKIQGRLRHKLRQGLDGGGGEAVKAVCLDTPKSGRMHGN